MTNPDELQNIMGRTAVDSAGDKIGKIGQIYLDDASGAPQWVTISTGLFGNKESFAPIGGYRLDGDDVVLNVTKDQVKDAPNVDADGHLEESENDALYEHYRGFLDTGTTFPEDRSFEVSQLRYGTGIGLSWLSPVGPLKISYGIPFHKQPGDETERFQFQIGTGF